MHDIRNGICPLCDHREIIEARALQLYGETGERVASLAVTYDCPAGGNWNTDEAHGLLKSYVCRACGYVQSFASNPGGIPIDSQNDTRLIKGDGAKPYR